MTFVVFWIAVVAFLGWPAVAFTGTAAIAVEVLWLALLAIAFLAVPAPRRRITRRHAALLAQRKAAVQARAAAQRQRREGRES